jgi:hypothetical protein
MVDPMVDPGGLRPPGPNRVLRDLKFRGNLRWKKRFGIKSLQKFFAAQIQGFEDAPVAAY